MRGPFGLIGLLIVLAVVALLARRALTPAVSVSGDGTMAAPTPRDPKAQQAQFKQAVEDALRAPRPLPDDR